VIGWASVVWAASPLQDQSGDELLQELPEEIVEGGIVGGAIEQEYPSALGLGAGPYTVCTGSLITPRMVLTAAHCGADLPLDLVVQFGHAIVGTRASEPEATLKFVDAVIHPDYAPLSGTFLGENDVSVLVLSEDAPIEPVWIRTEPIKPADNEGAEVVSVGWGLDENGGSGVKRSATLTVGSIDPMFLVSYSSENAANANICSGDSGGPMYHVEEDGTLLQWGVHSWGDLDCRYESGSTRVDKMSGWILEQVELVHGTADRCAIFGQYGDGVCHTDCAEVDEDCVPPVVPGEGEEDEEEARACGCDGARAPLPLGALALGLLLVRARRPGPPRSRTAA
jgi:V8-like Glu-specific endopeptidase